MEYIKIEKFRLKTISRATGLDSTGKLITEELPAIEGLGVEYQLFDGSYIVVSFIKYSKEDEAAYLDLVGNRILELTADEFTAFKKLCNIGIGIIECLYEEKDGE